MVEFEHLGGDHAQPELLEAVRIPLATHLRFRVMK